MESQPKTRKQVKAPATPDVGNEYGTHSYGSRIRHRSPLLLHRAAIGSHERSRVQDRIRFYMTPQEMPKKTTLSNLGQITGH